MKRWDDEAVDVSKEGPQRGFNFNFQGQVPDLQPYPAVKTGNWKVCGE
jgi:hypothetical protein